MILICNGTLWASENVHILKKGETLYSLSREYNISIAAITKLNNIINPSNLKIGMLIKIPQSYIVKGGDTLYGIARTHNIPLDELLNYNALKKDDALRVGQLIIFHEINNSKETDEYNENLIIKKMAVKTEKRKNYWPHNGVRTSLSGKLKGEQFLGEKGDSVISISSGKVVWVAPYRGYNKLIIIESADKHIYVYGGNEETLINVGDKVDPGMEIGKLGINPHEGIARMFFFVYKNGKPVDPEAAPRE